MVKELYRVMDRMSGEIYIGESETYADETAKKNSEEYDGTPVSKRKRISIVKRFRNFNGGVKIDKTYWQDGERIEIQSLSIDKKDSQLIAKLLG